MPDFEDKLMGLELLSLLGPDCEVSVVPGTKKTNGVADNCTQLGGVLPPVIQERDWFNIEIRC